jgi:protein-L-isoaspartate(D-aspartate) O-methyltransferase
MADFAVARQNMVLSQLEPNQVTDPSVTEAMASVPREAFVPSHLAGVAYVDEDLEIAPGRYVIEPVVLARMLQAADIKPGDLVLDIGCGTGYSTAVLARLAATVVALENESDLAARATETLARLAVDNAAVVTGPLALGMAAQGPYDVIVLQGAIPDLPAALGEQLADDGRLVAVTGSGGIGKATLFGRHEGVISGAILFDAGIPPLPGFEQPDEFIF